MNLVSTSCHQNLKFSILGWGAAIFLFGAVVLLLCDKESEEIYYKERKIVHDTTSVRD